VITRDEDFPENFEGGKFSKISQKLENFEKLKNKF
jgi:hypothetical protein